ncbi:hypothetical protein HBI25_075840 [Parastagonospora nodorum]|nr:hypothetical protein HBI73_017420 [Parastagonospora nodorum]KAH5282625.1 hypothetical protein HBI70_063260 [Parastagonospora nodorum]KAH5473820.1 hypothetical protein HBI28_117390 [Parastagonospora nodorum]KAH5564969.1 hypothetical protein HBI25_075840 [Parastagonospora nodorum]KAH5633192.1 hypothetical protein HBI22_103230 [Parastagonospora nodorum]
MLASWSLSFSLLFATLVQADFKKYISTSADIRTECKTCPRSLCPNQLSYDFDEALNVTCWTRGTKIMGDQLWLKSDAGCYITQYDVAEYAGDYTDDIPYCGSDSEEQNLTLEDATLKYKTECRICPQISCDTVAYLREDTELELTCWYPDGQVIIDDPYWMKTTNNCYVAQANLYSKPDTTSLDPCGPVPLLETANHNNENGTSDVNKREISPGLAERAARYLVSLTIGEEYSSCRSCADTPCSVEKVYEFNQTVVMQCLVETNGTVWWSLTTDFCYIKATDVWETPEGDFYRMPLCSYFDGDGDGGGGGDE